MPFLHVFFLSRILITQHTFAASSKWDETYSITQFRLSSHNKICRVYFTQKLLYKYTCFICTGYIYILYIYSNVFSYNQHYYTRVINNSLSFILIENCALFYGKPLNFLHYQNKAKLCMYE